MAWRDQWQTASFRGVTFRFRSASATLGRRNVVHRYPGRDEPFVEDMGRKAREFTIEAFVLGDDYIVWRDQLEAACEQFGPGELVSGTATSGTGTPAQAQATQNDAAVAQLMQRSGLVVAARAAASIQFASSTDALVVRDSLVDRLDAAAETASDEVYFALTNLRVAVVRDIAARAADLATLMQYTPKATMPAIVLAYTLYGDPERADEIVARNAVRHPGFVPGGATLEVLSNG